MPVSAATDTALKGMIMLRQNGLDQFLIDSPKPNVKKKSYTNQVVADAVSRTQQRIEEVFAGTRKVHAKIKK